MAVAHRWGHKSSAIFTHFLVMLLCFWGGGSQQLASSYLQRMFMMTESSRTEFCRRGLEPSHLRIVPSSSGCGRKLSTDDTSELLLMIFICAIRKREREIVYRLVCPCWLLGKAFGVRFVGLRIMCTTIDIFSTKFGNI